MYRALYIYDIADLHLQLKALAEELREYHPELKKVSASQLALRWIRHHLIRDHFLVLLTDPVDLLVDASLHNEFLIAYPNLSNRFYRQVNGCPHRYPEDPCLLRVTDRTMVLDYRADPLDYSVYAAQR
jgi:hypothetical protein